MAYTSSISAYGLLTNENLRQWGQGISQGISFAGLVNTNASGSINWSTAVASTGSSFVYGYEVFRFNDALQATAPIFLKLTYTNRDVGAGPGATAPRIVVEMGTTHNGSGTIGGQLFATGTTVLRYTGGSPNQNPWYRSLFAAGDGWFNAAFHYDNGDRTYNWYIGIERTRDYNGNTTSDGFGWILGGADNGGGVRTGYVPFSGTVPSFQFRLTALPSPCGYAFTNGKIMFSRVYWMNGGAYPVPATVLMYPSSLTFPPNSIFNFSPFQGMNAKYFRLPLQFVDSLQNGQNGCFAMRIE